jgi:alkanesulfonate monooxygenase SsuD/methylene tetrahydromethanopterin reductase-like flavin-dependent oxidoreductase (luciferase family)
MNSILADELGFDGVCVNEHHQNAYGTMPSPNLMGAILARQTKRVKIAVIGNALPLYNPVDACGRRVRDDRLHQRRPADCRAGRRRWSGILQLSRSIRRTPGAMLHEALDLVIRAWTEPGPFEHYGEHWKLKYVNPWPRPIQQPHPPVWIPGAGSKETIEMVAARRFGYMGIPYFHIDFFQRNFDLFREAVQKSGYEAHPVTTRLALSDLCCRDR